MLAAINELVRNREVDSRRLLALREAVPLD